MMIEVFECWVNSLLCRYTAAQKYDELEDLFVKSSEFLLENKQVIILITLYCLHRLYCLLYMFCGLRDCLQDESGMDVAIMLANLYKTASSEVTEKRVSDATK
jgi:hypothetical protein